MLPSLPRVVGMMGQADTTKIKKEGGKPPSPEKKLLTNKYI
jgi:hypothetical protein